MFFAKTTARCFLLFDLSLTAKPCNIWPQLYYVLHNHFYVCFWQLKNICILCRSCVASQHLGHGWPLGGLSSVYDIMQFFCTVKSFCMLSLLLTHHFPADITGRKQVCLSSMCLLWWGQAVMSCRRYVCVVSRVPAVEVTRCSRHCVAFHNTCHLSFH